MTEREHSVESLEARLADPLEPSKAVAEDAIAALKAERQVSARARTGCAEAAQEIDELRKQRDEAWAKNQRLRAHLYAAAIDLDDGEEMCRICWARTGTRADQELDHAEDCPLAGFVPEDGDSP